MILLLIAAIGWVRAETLLPPDRDRVMGAELPRVALLDESGRAFDWQSLRGKPTVLSLIYVRCKYACSTITENLKGAIESGTQVLSVSFDPEEKTETLQTLRTRFKLPTEWKIARGERESVAELLRAVDFRTLTLEDGEFGHPNLVYVLDGDLKVREIVSGPVFSKESMARALATARGEPLSFFQSYRPWVLVFSALGLVLSLLALVAYAPLKKSPVNA